MRWASRAAWPVAVYSWITARSSKSPRQKSSLRLPAASGCARSCRRSCTDQAIPTAMRRTMPANPFHLGWFMNFTPGEWDHSMAAGGAPWDGRFYVDMAQALERACFDYIMIEDTLMVSETYGGSAEASLKHAQFVPKHDPSPLAAIISAATRDLGVVATFSTLAYPPFMLARLCSTMEIGR